MRGPPPWPLGPRLGTGEPGPLTAGLERTPVQLGQSTMQFDRPAPLEQRVREPGEELADRQERSRRQSSDDDLRWIVPKCLEDRLDDLAWRDRSRETRRGNPVVGGHADLGDEA